MMYPETISWVVDMILEMIAVISPHAFVRFRHNQSKKDGRRRQARLPDDEKIESKTKETKTTRSGIKHSDDDRKS